MEQAIAEASALCSERNQLQIAGQAANFFARSHQGAAHSLTNALMSFLPN
jgi:hypothetical protein